MHTRHSVVLSCCGAFNKHILQTIIMKKSSLMVIMLSLIIFCCYRASACYFAQAWTVCNYLVLQMDVLHPDALRTDSTLFTEVLFHWTRALKEPTQNAQRRTVLGLLSYRYWAQVKVRNIP